MTDQLLSGLADHAVKGRLCLVLGAGVNADLGLPLWDALMRKLCEKLGLNSDEVHQEPMLLFDLLDQDQLAQKALRECLYEKNDSGQCFPDDWVKELKATHALSAVVELVATLAKFTHHQRDFHVITYNMDVMLEEALAARGCRALAIGKRRYVSFGFDNGNVPTARIYHPHGIVERAPRGDSQVIDIVLGRKDYGELYSSPLDDRNVAQLAAFQRDCCLFYGFSFQDPNVERLLRLAARYKRRWRGALGHAALVRAEWNDGDGTIHSHTAQIKRSTFTRLSQEGIRLDLEHRITRRLYELGVVRSGWYSYQQQRFVIDDLTDRIRLFGSPVT